MPRNRKPHPHHKTPLIVDPFGKPLTPKRPDGASPVNRKLFELQERQEEQREAERAAGTFTMMEFDELAAIRKFAYKIFGDARTRYPWPDGEEPFRYGGVIEGGPEEIGVLYVGFFIDGPEVNAKLRRRQLLFRGCKISEFEEQAKLLGMMQ